MKKWITLLLMIAVLCTMAVPAWAAEDEDVLMISPGAVITQTASAAELAEKVGFSVEELTELPFIPAEIVY